MKRNENTKFNRSWMTAFSVATTAFAAHAGGGFATGNQENTWFVSLGWPAIVGVAVAMLLLAMTIREGQIMMNSRGLKTYKELFECLYHPFDKVELLFELFFNIMVLMVVASCISGAASALTQYFGLNYYLGTFVIGLVVLFLTIFGVDLIRRASTYMGIVILVLAVSIYTIGLLNGHNLLDVMRVDFSVHGWSQLPKAVWNGVTYSAFQWVTVPAILVCGTSVLKTKQDCDRSMALTFTLNMLGLGLAVLMLLCWQHYYLTQPNGTTLPTLTTLKSFGANWLVALYGLVLFLCLISSAVCVIFGFVNRFENVKFLQKVENVPVRRALVSAFIMVVSMGISFVGLTNVVKYGYGYCGYLGIAIIIVPLLTVGFYKNRKFMKENSQDAKVSFEEVYEEN